MSFQEALDTLSRDERFKATVYAMNSLLIHKGIYTLDEFEHMFVEYAEKKSHDRTATEIPRHSVPAL